MKLKHKWALFLPILLAPTVITTVSTPVVEAHATVTLEKPRLQINEKGKVDIISSDGTVKSKSSNVNEFIKKYRVVIAGISGIGATSMILFFILNFLQIGAWSAEPQQRAIKIRALIASAVAAAGLGAVSFITGIFYNAL